MAAVHLAHATGGDIMKGFISAGLAAAVVMTVLSPSIWEFVLLHPKGSASFPYRSPTIFSMPLGFLGCWLFSVLDNSRAARLEQAAFEPQYVRSQTGIGAEGAASH